MKKGKALSVLVLAAAMLLSGLFCAGSLASGAVVTSITVKNTAPIAENLELTTYRGVGVAGTFKAIDPEGDPFVFEVTSEPKKGVVIPGDGDTFLYTPTEGKSGRDSFTYTAMDENGNTSAEAKVSITIRRQSGAVTYSDMAGDPAQYAALRLAEEDVFTGDRLGSESFFRPAEEVTRGEFLAMCLKIRGIKPLEGITRTSFADDEEAAAWVRPYISAALISGYIRATPTITARWSFPPTGACGSPRRRSCSTTCWALPTWSPSAPSRKAWPLPSGQPRPPAIWLPAAFSRPAGITARR